jgi:hypothetical protein
MFIQCGTLTGIKLLFLSASKCQSCVFQNFYAHTGYVVWPVFHSELIVWIQVLGYFVGLLVVC